MDERAVLTGRPKGNTVLTRGSGMGVALTRQLTSLRRAPWASVSCAIDNSTQETDVGLSRKSGQPNVHSALSTRHNRLSADFLQIDSEIALTLAGIALETTNEERRRRMILTARRAFDTIIRLRKDVVLSDAEGDKLDFNLLRLKGELQSLGQSI